MDRLLLLLWLIESIAMPTQSAKILLIPGNMNSHTHYFARLGDQLARLGHRTLLLAPSNGKIPTHLAGGNFTIDTFPVKTEVPFTGTPEMSKMVIDMALGEHSFIGVLPKIVSMTKAMAADVLSDCTAMLENKTLVEMLQKERYDFAVMDLMCVCCYLLPYSLAMPYSSFSVGFSTLMYRVPRLPSMVPPAFFASVSDEMTFKTRLLSLTYEFIMPWLLPAVSADFFRKYAPHRPTIDSIDLVQQSSLWFYLEDLAVGLPVPNMPNTVSIGDVMAQPAKPLPVGLRQFIDESPDGAVVLSLGSYIDVIPEDVAAKFCSTFRSLKYRVIWKFKSPELCPNASNVRILPWIPQNDVLAHRNVKLFITHGGWNSLLESVYHAKPVIVFPIFGDQPGNAAIAIAKGFGIYMDIAHFAADDLTNNINRILSEESFQASADLASAILRDKPESAAERASFLIEHVLKYGDRHLRTGAFNLSTAQFILFDIFAAIFGAFIALLIVLFLIGRCVYRSCCKSVGRVKKKAD